MFDEQRFIQLKQNFARQKFQWIKPDRVDLLGKVVMCRDIEPLGNMFFAVFEDGSKIDVTKLNTHLMMITGDAPALSMEEVNAIYKPQRPPSVTQNQTNPIQNTQQSTNVPPVNNSKPVETPVAPPPVKKANMFEMFNSESSVISLNISAKLPDRKLLKMMYSSAENKETFLNELSEYLLSLINKQVIKDSVSSMLNPVPPKKEKDSEPKNPIKLYEVNNGSK